MTLLQGERNSLEEATAARLPRAGAEVLHPEVLHPDVVRRVAVCLDEEVAGAFGRLTRVAVAMTGVPVALVSLVDGGRLHFRGHVGLPEPFASLREAPLANSFCEHVIETGGPLIVDDARAAAVHRQKPAFRELGVVAYLGVPLRTPGGVVLGTLCLIDTRARGWTPADLAHLEDVSRCVLVEIELRAALSAVRAAPAMAVEEVPQRRWGMGGGRVERGGAEIDALYERHAAEVYGVLLSLTDDETAERLLTATFERAAERLAAQGGWDGLARLGVGESDEATGAWLCRLALGRAQRAGLFSFRAR